MCITYAIFSWEAIIVGEGLTTSKLCVRACEKAVKNVKLSPTSSNFDTITSGSMSFLC